MKTVVRGIIRSGGRYLVMRRTPRSKHSPGKWEFPGGKAKDGEAYLDAFKREIMEETGMEVSPGRSFEMEVQGQREVFRIVCYFCDAGSEEVKMSDEHTEFKWSEMEEIVRMDLSDNMKKCIGAMERGDA